MTAVESIQNQLNRVIFNHRQWVDYFYNEPLDQLNLFRFPHAPVEDGSAKIGRSFLPKKEMLAFPSCGPEGKSPVYIITMPFLVSGFDDKYQKLKEKVKLIKNESFGRSSAASALQAAKRLALVIGQNRCLSLDERVNRKFISYIEGVPRINGIAFRTFGFFWEPQWAPTVKRKELYSKERSFLLLKVLRPDAADRLSAAIEAKKGHFSALRSQIPYQQIRETIKNSPFVQAFAEEGNASLYLALLDDDIVQLRTDKLGLYSHYDQLIEQFDPDVATTGYRAPDGEVEGMRIAVALDMAVRDAVASVVPLGPYYPEPNMIVRLVKPVNKYSYLGGNSERLESRRIIQNGIGSKLIDSKKLVFSAEGSAAISLDRLKTDKISKFTEVNSKTAAQKGFLEAIHGISQTHAFAKQWAENLYAALPVKCRVTDCTTPLMCVFSTFDLTRFCRDFSAIQGKKYSYRDFQLWKEKYSSVVELFSSAKTRNEKAEAFAELFFDAEDESHESAKKFFLTKFDKFKKALADLGQLGLDQEWVEKIVLAGKRSGEAIHQLLFSIG